MHILIVEDELLIAEMLKEMLLELGHIVVAIAKNYELAITALKEHNDIDFCFLDINLRGTYTGLDVATYMANTGAKPFVFLTSYSDKQTIANAIKYGPQAYLIKPFTEVDLYTTLELVNNRLHNNTPKDNIQTIVIKDGTKISKLNVQDILWLKSDNIYVAIRTVDKTHLIRNSLIQYIQEMNIACIKRVHRTYAVNINKVDAITGQQLIIGDSKIPISRKYRAEIMQYFR